MAAEGEDFMMDWDSFSFDSLYFNPGGQSIDNTNCPSTDTFIDPSEPGSDPIAKMEPVQEAIASAAPSAELVSTSNVEFCASLELQAKRRATQSSFDDNSRGALELVTESDKGKEKRGRATNWSNDAKEAFLKLKLEALEKSEKSWFRFVSEQLCRRHDIERADQSCQRQWDSLYKAYKAIRNLHDLMNSQPSQVPHMHPGVLFWDMEESARIVMEKKWNEELKYLPGVFPKEWYDLMEKIIDLQAQGLKKTQDVKITNHVGKFNREQSTTSTTIRDHAASWPGAWDSSINTTWNQQAWQLGSSSSAVLYHESLMKQPSNDKVTLSDDEELMSRITLLVDQKIEQALIMLELLRREEDNEQKYRAHAREAEFQRRLQEYSQVLLAMEAEISRRLQAMEAELLRLLRRVEEVEQKHQKSLADMLDVEELDASLKLTSIKERRQKLAGSASTS